MAVWIVRIFAPNGEVGDHALRYELAVDVLAQEFDALRKCQLDRQAELDGTRKLRVFTLLGSFDAIPEELPVVYPGGRGCRRAYLREFDPRFVRVVMSNPVVPITKFCGGLRRGGRYNPVAACPRYEGNGEVIDGQCFIRANCRQRRLPSHG